MNSHKKEKSTMHRHLLAPIVLLLLALAVPAFAYTPPAAGEIDASSSSFLLRDGVVVDPARGALYVMQEGGVAAFSTGGDELWKSDEAARPVGLYGDQLIALAESPGVGSAQIVLLAVQSGEKLAAITAALPEGAGGWVVDRPHQSFDMRSLVSGGQVVLGWRFSARPLRGAAVVSAGEPSQELTELEGQLRLDPVNATATALSKDAELQVPSFRFDLAAEERLEGLAGRQFRAGDDRHVLASQKITAADAWNRYRWILADRNGGVLGTIDRPVSTASFFITGTTLIHEAGPSLRRLPSGELEMNGLRLLAVDLAGGSELWSIDVRDTVYRGIMPP